MCLVHLESKLDRDTFGDRIDQGQMQPVAISPGGRLGFAGGQGETA